MNSLKEQMLNILADLKENHHVIGVKSEFEAEGTSLKEAICLKEIVKKSGLNLTIKIGGCATIKDLYEAKEIGADSIVAPMIESPYAVQKYLNTAKLVFSKEEYKKINFYINLETKYGFQYIEDILENDYSKDLTGIVLGRTDLAGSLNLDKDEINNDIIFEYANKLALYSQKYQKEFIIGGGICTNSLQFLKQLPKNTLTGYETRKIIFDKEAIYDKNANEGILKAIKFELMCLNNRRECFGKILKSDEERIQLLEKRYQILTPLAN